MEQKNILDNLNYYRAQKSAEKLLELGLITVDEFNKFQAVNAHIFSPPYADLFPKTVDKSSDKR